MRFLVKSLSVVVVAMLFVHADLRADLIAHYTFDDGEPTDEEGGFDGIAEGDAVSDGPGVEGLAFRFSGAGHIEIPINVSPSIYPELTVTMWVKADPNIPNTPGLYKTFGHDDGGWDRTFGLDNRNAPFRWAAFTGTGPTVQETGTPVTSEWTFLAVVWDSFADGGPMVRIHANENYITEALVDTEGSSSASIGSLRPDNFNEGWRGLIDEVQIHDVALSVDEVEEVRAEVPPPGAGPPIVTTRPAIGFGEGTATLQGVVNPSGLATTAFFEWGPTTAYGNTTPEMDVGAGFADSVVEAALQGLDIGGTYHFRVVATNASGTSMGEDEVFLVPDPSVPLVQYTFDDGQPTDESGNGRDGVVGGDAMSFSPGIGDDGEAFQFLGQGHIEVPLDISPTVYPDLTVTMWVKAAEGIPEAPDLYKTFGHDDGGWDRTFGLDNRNGPYRWAAFTGGGPTLQDTGTPVTTEWTFLAAVWDTADDGSATIRFHANASHIVEPLTNTNGAATASIGSLRPDNFNEGWQGLIDEVKIFGSALTEEEVEAVRAEFAENEPGPPEAVTLAPGDVAPGTATLHGRVFPNGAATTAWFEYGTTTAYGMTTPEVDVGDGFGAVLMDAVLEDLDEEQRYHYRLAARSPLGTSEGEDQSFFAPNRQALLAHYTFEGAEALDVSGNENHGIPEGDAMPADSDRDEDEDGEAFRFSGAGHIVVPIDLNPSNYPDLTVTMWVKADDLIAGAPGLYKTFGHDNGGWDRTFGLDQRDPGLDFRWAAFTGMGVTDSTGEPVTPDWTFLAAVWDTDETGAATIRFHANEAQVIEPATNTTGQTTAAIGSLRPDNFDEGWQGLIDDVRIFGSALTEEEIATIRSGVPPPPHLIPGNVNGDGDYNISDPVAQLTFQFGGGALPECYVVPGSQPAELTEAGMAILDFNGDGASNITDAVASLDYLFGGGAPPAIGIDCVEVPGGCSDQCP